MSTWHSEHPLEIPRVRGAAWLLVAPRLLVLALVLGLGLAVLFLLRAAELALAKGRRPLTGFLPQICSRLALPILGISLRVEGRGMPLPGALVANHASWLDIFVLNAAHRVTFVSKAEVAGWPGIGVLARATGTLFIARDRRAAEAQRQAFLGSLRAGKRLLFFPEGTSTDGQRVLDFKPTLFAAFFEPDLKAALWVQPVTVRYQPPRGADPRAYAWWGDMEFAPHLLAVMAMARRGAVRVTFHPPIQVAGCADRKALAKRAEAAVRAALG